MFNPQNSQHQHHQHQQNSQNDLHPQQPKLARSPSVLPRLRSINFYHYRSHDSSSIANHFKTTPDSDAYYDFERTHQSQNLGESHSQYIFEQAHQPQNLGESHSQYIFEQTHQEQPTLFLSCFGIRHSKRLDSAWRLDSAFSIWKDLIRKDLSCFGFGTFLSWFGIRKIVIRHLLLVLVLLKPL